MAGPLPLAPLNHLTMLTGYVDPAERSIACPNQDVVYGVGSLALDVSPVVVQVPDFGDRFWVYQGVDLRTDSFVQIGKMYGSTPGFYLLVGPNWKGEVPKGITRVFRASSKDLALRDGSLTIHVQAAAPSDPMQRANWLPAPTGEFSLYIRAYWPGVEILEGSWTPPPVRKAK